MGQDTTEGEAALYGMRGAETSGKLRVEPGSLGSHYAERHILTLPDGSEHKGKSAEFDACRHLAGQGITGKLNVYGPDGDHRMVIDIAKGKTLSVIENEKTGPKFGKWKPFARPST